MPDQLSPGAIYPQLPLDDVAVFDADVAAATALVSRPVHLGAGLIVVRFPDTVLVAPLLSESDFGQPTFDELWQRIQPNGRATGWFPINLLDDDPLHRAIAWLALPTAYRHVDLVALGHLPTAILDEDGRGELARQWQLLTS